MKMPKFLRSRKPLNKCREAGRRAENRSTLAKNAKAVCFRSGAEGTRTLDLLRDRQTL